MRIPEWSAAALADALADPGRRIYLLDVRTEAEYAQGSAAGAHNMPLDTIDGRHGEIPGDVEVVCLCPDGERSAVAVVLLAAAGHRSVALLAGGLSSLGIATDPDLDDDDDAQRAPRAF